jgi:hypothetical protein
VSKLESKVLLSLHIFNGPSIASVFARFRGKMSFFGFDATLERDKHKFAVGEDEDLAVYTFGEEGYDGLADALDEGLDELNDETFGGGGAVGERFII